MTTKQRQAIEALLTMIADTVREIDRDGLGCPNGPVYAALMGVIDLQTYNALLDVLIARKQIRRTPTLLYWIGE